MRRVTAQDVAAAAGVSQSAVSRVFGAGSASPAMTARVRAVADRMGYRPDAVARAMSTGRSRLVGLVVAHLDNPFYALAIERLSRALQAEGLHLVVHVTGPNASADPDGIIRDLMDHRVDGVIAASVNLSGDLARRCAEAGLPVVLFNRAAPGTGLPAVTSDNRDGARAAARFLVAGGHRRVAHVAGWQGSSTGRDRARGLAEGLAEASLPVHAQIDGHYDGPTAARAALAMMDMPRPPDAIVAGNDLMALAVMDALRDRGLRVPEDVSVVGFDDVPAAAWGAYRLTTVRQDADAMVAACVDDLVARIAQPGLPHRHHLTPAPLVVRDSARVPPGTRKDEA